MEVEQGLEADGAGAGGGGATLPLPSMPVSSLSSSMSFRDFGSRAAAEDKSEAELWKDMSQSDVMKGVIEKIEGRNIKKAEFSIMAFFADESIQRKYPRRFGCFKKCLPNKMTEARVETFFSSAENDFPAIKKSMNSEKLSEKMLCKHGEKRYPTEALEVQATYKKRRTEKAASAYAAKKAKEAADAAAAAVPGANAAGVLAAMAAVEAAGGMEVVQAAMVPAMDTTI